MRWRREERNKKGWKIRRKEGRRIGRLNMEK